MNTLCCVGVFRSQRFVSQLYCQFPGIAPPTPSRASWGSGNRECVCQGSPLAGLVVCLSFWFKLPLSYVLVFIYASNGDWLIMWFLVGIESLLETSPIYLFIAFICPKFSSSDFKYFYPTVSRVHTYACQTTCQFMV